MSASVLDMSMSLDAYIAAPNDEPGNPGGDGADETFRGSGPSNEQTAAMLSASVAEYDVGDVRPLFGKEAE